MRAAGKELHDQTSWRDFSRQRSVLLSIGINLYQRAPNLEFARNDAEELVSTLKNSGRQNVQVQLLIDSQATKEGSRRSMDEIIGQVEEDDQVWLFFAGVEFRKAV
jgi:hypothetical protein